MFFIETPIVYKELLFSKIKSLNKILILDYNKNYDNIFDNIDIIKNLQIEIHILNVKENEIEKLYKKTKEYDYNKIKFFSKDILDLEDDIKYDNIICFNIFCKLNEKELSKVLDKSKIILKNKKYSTIIFINNVITRYNQFIYHPLSYFRNYFYDNCVYITDMYDKLRYNDLYIIDSYRLFTFQIPTYPLEFFSVICVLKI
jgi:hypothetical protein